MNRANQPESSSLLRQNSNVRPFAPKKEGVVVECLSSQDVGAYWKQGTELARIGQGERIVRVLLDDRKITESRPEVGDKVNVRLKDSKTHACSGRITRVEPGGNNMVDMEGLTQSAGGDIIADQEGRTQEVYFIVDIALEESVAADVPQLSLIHISEPTRPY